jgi:hypothetical protein
MYHSFLFSFPFQTKLTLSKFLWAIPPLIHCMRLPIVVTHQWYVNDIGQLPKEEEHLLQEVWQA